jgi:hypothetical protein
VFEWVTDPGGTGPDWDDNDGTVIKPDGYSGSGRWIRQVDVRGPFHAEWFGAKGDGNTDDSAAIQKCLNTFGRVTLLAKTYRVGASIVLPRESEQPCCRIEGQGMEKTRVVSRIPDPQTSTWKVAVFQYYDYNGSGLTATNNAVIGDLTIDCGFNECSGGSRMRTRNAISLVGEGNIVERVKVINFGVGYDPGHTGEADRPGECFVINLETYRPNLDQGRLGTIRDCLLTQPGGHTDIHGAYRWPEITGLCLHGRAPYVPGGPQHSGCYGVGGGVTRNRFVDLPYNKTYGPVYQPSQPHLITVCNCAGVEVAENEAMNCDGVGVYIVSWSDEDVFIHHNRLIGINCGVQIGVASAELSSCPPQHISTRLEDNLIVVGRNQAPFNSTFCGVFLTNDEVTDSTIRLKGIRSSRNVIRAAKLDFGAGAYRYPQGVYFRLDNGFNPNYQSLAVSDNVLEVPDIDPADVTAGWPGTPYENAIVFWPGYRYVGFNPKVVAQLKVHGNRNLAGSDLRLKALYTGTPLGCGWGVSSNRTGRFKAPVFSGRAGVFYDEFLGAPPRFSLGWVDASSGGGTVVAPDLSQVQQADKHPGVVKLLAPAAAASGATALLKYGANTLTLQGNLTHSIEFAVKRSYEFPSLNPGQLYECRMGLFGTADDGIYFDVKYQALTDYLVGGDGYNLYRAWAKNGATSSNFWFTSDEGTGDVHFFGWHTCRIDLIPSPTADVSLEARFFYDGIPVWVAQNKTGQNPPIPTDSLFIAFRVKKVGLVAPPADRFLLVDYFQHQLY